MKKRITGIYLAAFALVFSTTTIAANQDECSIWLCLPVGFNLPSCQPAKIAMLKRMFEFKSPVPSFSSCEVQGPERTNTNVYDYRIGTAALMGGYINSNNEIVAPEEKIVPGFCNFRDSGQEEPRGCIATLQVITLIENGKQIGVTYFRNKQGTDYIQDPETGEITPVSDSE